MGAANRDPDNQRQRREPDRLDLFLDSLKPNTAPRPWDDAETAKRKERKAELAERFAVALGMTVEAVIDQWKRGPDVLRARLLAADIDPNTGFPVNAEAHHEPAGDHKGIDTTTEPTAGDKPAEGNVGAHCDDPPKEFDCPADDLRDGLGQLGITPTVHPAPPDVAEPFEDLRRRTVEQLLKQGA